jgi:hypothetical protein
MENAGYVYLIMPQLSFNILKPIAKGFDLFIDRFVKDPLGFFKIGSFLCDYTEA